MPSFIAADVPADAARRAAALVTCSPDPIIGFALDGTITEWNPAAHRTYGYSLDEALGAPGDLIVPPELSSANLFERVIGGETISGFDTQRVSRDGERFDVSISMSPITDEHGAIVGAAVFTRDIRKRTLAEKRLRRSEMLLAEAEELAGLGSWEWDIATNDVFWSAGLFRILGLDPDEVAPTYEGYVARFHPEDRELAEQQMAEAIASGSVVLQHTRMLGDDGVERITQSRARIMRDADGNPVRLRGTTQDVSEIVRATHRLDVANRRNQALLNSAGEGIYGIDRDGTTTFVNPVAARLMGYDVEDLVGRSRQVTFRHTRSDGTPYRVSKCPVSASLLDGTVHRCDSDLYWRRDGTSFPVEYTSTPIFEDTHVVGAVVVFKDISKRRETERRKDDFIASVSHELRTPLTSILGYLELIGDDETGELTAKQRRYLGIVDRNADRLLRVVGDLLLVAQFDAEGTIDLKLADVDVAQVVAHAVEVAGPQAQDKGLVVATQIAPMPTLRGDGARLGQVIDNLLSNAVKFTPSGGRVDVRAFVVEDRAVLEIADTGLGMTALEQEQLFQRFYRTAAAAEHVIQGTGLGLTIVKGLVEAHGGRVSVTSAVGQGTTFRVELPLR